MRPCSQRRATAEPCCGLPQDLGGDRTRQGAQRVEAHGHGAVAPDREPIELGAGGLIERAHRLARHGRQARERRRDFGVVRVGQQRQQLVADPVAQELRIAVRLVLDPREPGAPKLRLERRAANLDQRANDRSAHGRDTGQAAHARALHEPHQDGLGLIVGGVADRDTRSRRLGRRTPRAPRSAPPAPTLRASLVDPPRPSRRRPARRVAPPRALTKSASAADSARSR